MKEEHNQVTLISVVDSSLLLIFGHEAFFNTNSNEEMHPQWIRSLVVRITLELFHLHWNLNMLLKNVMLYVILCFCRVRFIGLPWEKIFLRFL